VRSPPLTPRLSPPRLHSPVLAAPPAGVLWLLAATALLAASAILIAWARRRPAREHAARFAAHGDLTPLHVRRPEPDA